jgi:uncharacterized protein YoxC
MDIVLLVSLVGSLAQIIQLLLEIVQFRQERGQARDYIMKTVMAMRSTYQEFCEQARQFIKSMRIIPVSVLEVQDVKTSVEDCKSQLSRIAKSVAVNDEETQLCLNALHQIKRAFSQFLKGLREGNKKLVYRWIGVIRHTMEGILIELEERYLPRPTPTTAPISYSTLCEPFEDEWDTSEGEEGHSQTQGQCA